MYSVTKFIVTICIISIQSIISISARSSKLLYSEQEIVDELVRKWSPLVWLAPNEKFLPGDVKTFLSNVHAEREKPNSQKIKDIGDNLSKYSHYYEDLVYYDGKTNAKIGIMAQNNRRRRNFDKDTSLEYIFELPIDNASENWFLVTNEELDNLMKNKSSFIYGEDPNAVPIYAVVSMCSSDKDFNFKNEIDTGSKWKKNPYIPLTKIPNIDVELNSMHILPNKPPIRDFRPLDELDKTTLNEIDLDNSLKSQFTREKRSVESEEGIKISDSSSSSKFNSSENDNDNFWKAITSPQPSVVIYTKDEKIIFPPTTSQLPLSQQKDTLKITNDPQTSNINIPHFHVSYWMFYPYSQGKTICTLNLGPLGPIPIPLIWNICLGTKKEFGSHVGDWEHVSIVFRGKMKPDEMYVSAHDAGAFYTYDRLTGTFEYKSQETRKGYLQHPTFPKTIITSENHPVLFAAEGSHGLWGSPGKHRFVRVPRLYDINGFGRPWQTWTNVEVIYNDNKTKRSLNPNWMRYRGKWGNPKNKCHPLKKIGLHVCELTDGPKGIPMKTSHFSCPSE
ncbi:hypothetical protein PVAND_002795 [Polypedilum vanderplanki]|uniref:Vacuolar protein sorting-associated protein 62 n=1 Tax=Polypedilum vanderplanki TaxID=319348 RepID=A0A9J6BSV7_POLVA|nr:hypothetical protein PVAND_002795 [Polypedilum vanderplanki]